MRYVVRNATVVDGTGAEPFTADISIRGNMIEQIGTIDAEPGDVEVDATGRLAMPGFIDAHSHVDGVLFDDDIQLALLRQGITTVIGGQDGVSYAPGDGVYATEYFAAINGSHPSYRGPRVSDLLSTFDETTRLNFAYLVPAATVRYEVMGRSTDRASDEQLAAMQQLVTEGLDDGAFGLSSGLDYVPGIFADAAELGALCLPVAAVDAVYVTHMRGGYEANSAEGIDEIVDISERSGVRTHISHFHAEADTLLPLLDEVDVAGVDLSFDAYPYTRGCTILGMPLLPTELSVLPTETVLAELAAPASREALRRDWFPLVDLKPSLGPGWPRMITLAHIAAPELAWAHGLTIAEASEKAGQDAIDFVLDLLLASRLEVNVVMAVRYARPVSELGRIFSSDAHVGGSDGIFVGAHPHPRARGSFTSYLREYVRENSFLTWPQMSVHLSGGTAKRFGLAGRDGVPGREAIPGRGMLCPGAIADLIVVDPLTVTDRATYEHPLRISEGIDDVFVAGVPVLIDGELCAATPGRGLRRAQADAAAAAPAPPAAPAAG
jgi:N-acyl-D-amino-acid deacylase